MFSYSGKQIPNKFQFYLIIDQINFFFFFFHIQWLTMIVYHWIHIDIFFPDVTLLTCFSMWFFSIKQGLHTNINLIKLLFPTYYNCSLFLHYLGFRLIHMQEKE